MSPEQALGERVDARSDLYSLGAVGYFALSGELPFQGTQATEVLAKQVTEPARPVGAIVAVPRRLAQAIDRCLAKDPAERPQKGEDLAEQLGLAMEQRRELPVALRVFVKHNARLGGTGGLLYILGIPWVMGIVGAQTRSGSAVLWTFAALVTVVPLGILVTRAHKFLQSGFGLGELQAAFRVELERGREERAFEYGRGPSSYERVLRVIGAGGLVTGMVTGVIIATTPFSSLGMWVYQLCGWGWASGLLAGFLALVRFERRVDIDTRIWSWVWLGPIGRALFRIAGAFVGSKALPPPATHRPTELNLALATEQLFSELPRATRKQLRDLPDVVHRLEQDAGKMRRRVEELQDALGAKGEGGSGTGMVGPARIVADLEAERDRVQRRLGDAVKALETIRLNLLRLRAGSGSVQSLTTDLGLARQVAEDIGHLLAAEREIDQALS